MEINRSTKMQPSLMERILLCIVLLTIVKIGNFIPIPGIDRETFFASSSQINNSSTDAIVNVLNTFSGGNNKLFGLLSLGILPYINASIIIQLLTTSIPYLKKLQKDEGEYGRRKIVEFTRYLTVAIAVLQSIGVTFSLKALIFNWNFLTALNISVILITGSLIVLWFSELITKDGIGNGSSLLICFNIVSNLPDQIKNIFLSFNDQTLLANLKLLIILPFIFFATTVGCVYLNEATIKIPLVSARQLARTDKYERINQTKSQLPLKINQAGVMPLIFTSSIMVIGSSILQIIKNKFIGPIEFDNILIFNIPVLFLVGKICFWGIYAGLIFFFTYFYSTIIIDPKDVAEQLRKNSVIIKGVPPGIKTEEFLTKILNRIASLNAIFLFSAILIFQLLGFVFNFSSLNINISGLGFTSQIILVNVLIDVIQKVRGFLMENEYIV